MSGKRKISDEIDVSSIARSLPQGTRTKPHVSKPNASGTTEKGMPSSLPECFYEVWKRRQSTLSAHRRERAALEAVASTMPENIIKLTGSAAAAAYLGALTVSLLKFIESNPANKKTPLSYLQQQLNDTQLSKRERKKQRKAQKEAEKTVESMKSLDLPHSKRQNHEADMEDTPDDEENNHTDENADMTASLLYLITLAVGGCSPAVINSKAEELLTCVMQTYDSVAGYGIVARHSCTLLQQVLSVLTTSMWSKPTVQRGFLYLLRQTADPDAKARRKAREAMDSLQKCPRAELIRRKTSVAIAGHYISQLEAHMKTLSRDDLQDEVHAYVRVRASMIHVLTSVERFAIYLQPSQIAKVSKQLVVVAMQASTEVTVYAFFCLASIFKYRHTVSSVPEEDEAQRQTSALSKNDLEKLTEALLQYEVVEDASSDLIIAYLNCIARASLAHLTQFSSSAAPMQFINMTIQRHILHCMKTLRSEEVSKAVFQNLRMITSESSCTAKSEIMAQLLKFITPKYKVLWPMFGPVLRSYLERGMASGHIHTEAPVKSIIEKLLKIRMDGVTSKDKKTIDFCNASIAAIVRGGGCERLLRACDVRYDPKDHVTNAWLLPILSHNLAGAPFHIFVSHFIPLTDKLREASQKTENQGRVIEAKNAGIYVTQVVGLVQGFCKKPSDLGHGDMFNHTFKFIYHCLMDKQRLCILHGAGAVRNLALSVSGLDQADPTAREKVSAFAKRFKKLVPTLFDVTYNAQDNNRDNLLQAITSGCQGCQDPAMVSQFLRKSIKSLLELQIKVSSLDGNMGDEDKQSLLKKQHAALDVATAVISSKVLSSDIEEIKYLQQAIKPYLEDSKESSLQKKGYRVLTVLLQAGALKSVETETETFLEGVSTAIKKVAAGAKAARLGFLTAVINLHPQLNSSEEKIQFLTLLNTSFLSEIVVGTRDSSEKTRAAAFDTLITMARAWNATSTGTNMDGLCHFIVAVAAGLGGKTVSMLSASLTSLGRLLYEYRGEMMISEQLANTVDSLFGTVQEDEEGDDEMAEGKDTDAKSKREINVVPGPIAILLRHAAAEVQKAALGVVKIATKVLAVPIDRLLTVLPAILPGLVHVAANSKKQEIRLRVRVILERLLRKCGRDVLEANFPKDHAKLLSSVRKKYSRDLIKKHADKEARKQAIVLRKKTSMDSEETNKFNMEDIGLDESDSDIEKELLDGDALLLNQRKVSLTDKKGPVNGDDDDIKFTDDGKPIIIESEDESGEVEIGSTNSMDGDGSDAETELANKPQSHSGKKRGRMEDGGRNEKKMKGSFGDEYRGRRGDGDVKRRGRPDPYAYVPLGANMMGVNRGKSEGSSLQKIARTGGKKKGRKGIPSKR